MFQASKFKFKMKKGATSSSEKKDVSSPQSKEKLVLDDKKFKEIRDFIYDNSGMYFNDSKKYLLENRLIKRLDVTNMKSFDEYFYYIRFDSKKDAELVELYNAVTINETSFFRNEPQIEAYCNEVVPEIIKTAKAMGRQEIVIWSAASSSGEEPYTLAMIIHQLYRKDLGSISVKIVGTDISTEILEQARKGIYNEYSVRNVPEKFMKAYFTVSGSKYTLSEEIKKYVTFKNVNLIDMNEMNRLKGADIIYCRNVLIYFDTASKTKVVSKLYDNLNHGGYLFIGHSESLHGITKAFKLVHFNKSIAYKKE